MNERQVTNRRKTTDQLTATLAECCGWPEPIVPCGGCRDRILELAQRAGEAEARRQSRPDDVT